MASLAPSLRATARRSAVVLSTAESSTRAISSSAASSSSSCSSSNQPRPSAVSPASRVRRLQNLLSPTRSISSSSPTAATVATSDASSPQQPTAPDAGSAPTWTPASRRVGLITRKVGMTSFFLSTGQQVPATILQVMSNQISAHRLPPTTVSLKNANFSAKPAPPYIALQVAAFDVHSKRGISKSVKGHLEAAGIQTDKRVLHDFRVTPDAFLPLGTQLSAVHFVPGQCVDVRAITKGKGFQGAMKRHGFHGLRASHGVSISHRSHGSTGQHQDPGRVFPGKKMAGRMGGTAHRTVQNVKVLRVDSRDELLFVQGQVPGPEQGVVYVTDAKRALVNKAAFPFSVGKLRSGQLAHGNEPASAYLPDGIENLPFPAGTKEMARSMPEVIEVGPVKRAAAAASS
ncbi:hypothetical protein OC846_000825 [Tilletia horrida]|uniref:Large ribosomal subunit protein uL3m n=1 Tax=Tilletia horrida TaxID=155126 RepID=A0AAN6GTW4_9BASI|nr:hypothetical protein OC845_002333 [Tilletia horrida]KAK0556980.1 hypothetical protein OC846_000825 [Tilletia horrida]KAK0566674.1 hypothetical protein OC861_003115 [Tilletia horrida]